MNIVLRALFVFVAFCFFNTINVCCQEDFKKRETVEFEIDFDALDEAIADFDIEQNIEIENPSKFTILLRSLAAPLVIKLVVTIDFIKTKWQEIKHYIENRLIKPKSARDDDETEIFKT